MFVVTGPHRGLGTRCEAILRSLPNWFGIEEAIVEYVQAIDTLDTFVAEVGDLLVGFMSVKRHFKKSPKLRPPCSIGFANTSPLKFADSER